MPSSHHRCQDKESSYPRIPWRHHDISDLDRVWDRSMNSLPVGGEDLRAVSPCRGRGSPHPRRHSANEHAKGMNRAPLHQRIHSRMDLAPSTRRRSPLSGRERASHLDELQVATFDRSRDKKLCGASNSDQSLSEEDRDEGELFWAAIVVP
jgi:hypothetical protein